MQGWNGVIVVIPTGFSREKSAVADKCRFLRTKVLRNDNSSGGNNPERNLAMTNLIIEKLLAKTKRTDLPDFAPGDTVRVQVKIKEGDKERLSPERHTKSKEKKWKETCT